MEDNIAIELKVTGKDGVEWNGLMWFRTEAILSVKQATFHTTTDKSIVLYILISLF